MERPILFSGPMVLAILQDRKTVTRRIVKVGRHPAPRKVIAVQPELVTAGDGRYGIVSVGGVETTAKNEMRDCKYGQPGDHLWVKETFMQSGDRIVYRADHIFQTQECKFSMFHAFKWKPSIYMPREHSRITLLIEDIRIERLQEITEEDAAKEGMHWPAKVHQFKDVWKGLYGEGAWEANPFVYRIQFRRVWLPHSVSIAPNCA